MCSFPKKIKTISVSDVIVIVMSRELIFIDEHRQTLLHHHFAIQKVRYTLTRLKQKGKLQQELTDKK